MLLPKGYEYLDFKKCGEDRYEIRCKLNEEEIKHWVKQFGQDQFVEWRIARTHPNVKGSRCFFKINYRCQHGSAYKQGSSSSRNRKSTNCPAQLTIKKCREFPSTIINTVITVIDNHNHAKGTTAASLKYRDVSEESQQNLRKLFLEGHSPSSAYHILQENALAQFGDNYYKIAADRNKVPDLKYCYNFFYKEFKKECTSLGIDDECFEDLTHSPKEEIVKNVIGESNKNEVIEKNENEANKERDKDQALDEFNTVFNDIKFRLQNNHSTDMIAAVEKFCKRYKTFCKSDRSLQSALSTFGKYSRLKMLPSSSKIDVQLKPIAKRKIQLQRKSLHAGTQGRLGKSFIKDILKHDYTNF